MRTITTTATKAVLAGDLRTSFRRANFANAKRAFVASNLFSSSPSSPRPHHPIIKFYKERKNIHFLHSSSL